jgi:hypothetical protein
MRLPSLPYNVQDEEGYSEPHIRPPRRHKETLARTEKTPRQASMCRDAGTMVLRVLRQGYKIYWSARSHPTKHIEGPPLPNSGASRRLTSMQSSGSMSEGCIRMGRRRVRVKAVDKTTFKFCGNGHCTLLHLDFTWHSGDALRTCM